MNPKTIVKKNENPADDPRSQSSKLKIFSKSASFHFFENIQPHFHHQNMSHQINQIFPALFN